MATRRQREAAAPRLAANAGPRNQTAAAAATGRPHARNRRGLGDIGNHVNARVVDGEANRRRLSPGASAPSSTPPRQTSLESTIAPSWAETDTIVEKMDSTDLLVQSYQRLANLEESSRQIAGRIERLHAAVVQLESDQAQKEAEVQKVMKELESEKAQKEAQVQKVMELKSEKAQKEAQVQKVMEENVRLHAMLDKKEAQLQAMSEQCKFMALNHHSQAGHDPEAASLVLLMYPMTP